MRQLGSIIIFALCVVLLVSCKATPDEPLVMQKDLEQMVEKATAYDAQDVIPSSGASSVELSVTSNDESAELAARLGVPERFDMERTYSDGQLTVFADADIVLPNVSMLPTVYVVPEDFSQELVNSLYEYLVGDTPMYLQTLEYTKMQLEEDIIFWQQRLSDPEIDDMGKKQAESEIAKINAAYASAPDNSELVRADATIGRQEEIDFTTGETKCEFSGVDIAQIPGLRVQQGKKFFVRNNTKNGEIKIEENVGGWTVTDTASQGARFYYQNYDLLLTEYCMVPGDEVSIDTSDRLARLCGRTYENVMNTAQDFINGVGIENMQVGSITMEYVLPKEYNDQLYKMDITDYEDAERISSGVQNGEYDHDVLDVLVAVKFNRNVYGVPVTSHSGSSYIDDTMFGKQWCYEELELKMCRKGIYSVAWTSPHDITETITKDTALRPFDEISEVFSNMFRVMYEDHCGQDTRKYCEITKVTLTLRRIMEQNNAERGLFVPVWDFYGTLSYAYEGEDMQDAHINRPIMTINAIDGSVIDLDKGY